MTRTPTDTPIVLKALVPIVGQPSPLRFDAVVMRERVWIVVGWRDLPGTEYRAPIRLVALDEGTFARMHEEADPQLIVTESLPARLFDLSRSPGADDRYRVIERPLGVTALR